MVPLLAVSTSLLGCASPVIKPMTTPQEFLSAESLPLSPDSIPGLRTNIQSAEDRTVILFLHGMGDACPGYAIDEKLGWLSIDVEKSLHIQRSSPNSDPHKADDTLTIPDFDTSDPKSTLVVQRNRYTSTDTGKEVDAVEVTWSGLDRWLKDNQLGYDISTRRLPSKPPDQLNRGDSILNCVDAVGGGYDQSRVPVNRFFKDGLMDRNLADVVVYVGSYGPKIIREFADAICRVVKDDPLNGQATERCDWSKAPSTFSTHFMFVTHSLGSRIVYDTLLELSGKHTRPDTLVLEPDGLAKGGAAIRTLMSNTKAIYMMANQLPMLGLAYASPKLTSSEGPIRLEEISRQASSRTVPTEAATSLQPSSATAAKRRQAKRLAISSANEHYDDPILSLATRRADTVSQAIPLSTPPRLDIVAFSDANDLLSYSLPEWYNDLADATGVYVTNVFVHNGIRWLWLLENPQTAHLGYITNQREVWKVIACGATKNLKPSCETTR